MKPTSRTIRVLFATLLVISVASGIAERVKTSNLDSANFLSFVDKQNLISPLESDYAATNDGLKDLITAKPSEVCAVIAQSNYTPRHFFRQHPYILATIISASGWLIPVPTNWLAGIWLGVSMVGGLLAIYVFLRKLKIPIAPTLLFLITVSVFPVFSNAYMGQIYMDILMFGPATALVLSIWWMKNQSTSIWRWVVLLTVLLGSISERGAYLAGLIGFGYSLLLFGKNMFYKREILYVSLSGLTMSLWGFVWFKFIMINRDYQGKSYRDALARLGGLLDEPVRPMFIIFLSTSLIFLCLTLFSGRAILITLGALTPTLLVSTGGAELSGFYTHYHQTYLPVLVATAVIGFVRINLWVKFSNPTIRQGVSITLGIALLVISLFNWTHFGQKASIKQLTFDSKYVLLPKTLNNYTNADVGIQRLKELTDYLETLNPKTISGGESIMPALFLAGFKDVEYWPVGVGVADVVVAPMDGGSPNVYPFGDWWGNGEELRACTMSHLETEYQLVRQFENYGVYQKQGG